MWFLGSENKWIEKLHNMRSVKSAYSPQKIRKVCVCTSKCLGPNANPVNAGPAQLLVNLFGCFILQYFLSFSCSLMIKHIEKSYKYALPTNLA